MLSRPGREARTTPPCRAHRRRQGIALLVSGRPERRLARMVAKSPMGSAACSAVTDPGEGLERRERGFANVSARGPVLGSGCNPSPKGRPRSSPRAPSRLLNLAFRSYTLAARSLWLLRALPRNAAAALLATPPVTCFAIGMVPSE